MALVNTDFVIREYTDDFGGKWTNLPIKIQQGAPKIDVIYEDRPSSLTCGGSIPFKPRRLRVTFNDGRTLLYPVSKPSDIITVAQILKPSLLDNAIPGLGADEAVCVALLGEEWTTLTPSAVGNLTYRKTAYTDIPERGIKESGFYNYTSDVVSGGSISLGYRIEKEPSSLLACQKEGMDDPRAEKGICSGAALGITPRRLILQALATAGGKTRSVIRQIPTSARGQLKSTAQAAADCAYCYGYKGESIAELSRFVGSTIAG